MSVLPTLCEQRRQSRNEHPAGASELLLIKTWTCADLSCNLCNSLAWLYRLHSAIAMVMLLLWLFSLMRFAPPHLWTLTSPHVGWAELIQLPSFCGSHPTHYVQWSNSISPLLVRPVAVLGKKLYQTTLDRLKGRMSYQITCVHSSQDRMSNITCTRPRGYGLSNSNDTQNWWFILQTFAPAPSNTPSSYKQNIPFALNRCVNLVIHITFCKVVREYAIAFKLHIWCQHDITNWPRL